jgi:predicted dehydrogenase
VRPVPITVPIIRIPQAAHAPSSRPPTSQQGKTMRVGILGAGAIARVHAQQWVKLPVTLAGCYDRHPDRSAAFCAEFGGRAYASLADMLADIDLITICTHTDSHRTAVMTAAEAGVAIVCEKPLARHLHDALEIAEICDARRVPLFVAQVVRFFPAYVQAKATVAAGTIGTPGTIRTQRAGSFPGAGGAFAAPFYADFARSGGVVLDLAVHDIDYQRWVCGEVERVFVRGLSFRRPPQADHAYITLRFANGAIGHIDANWALPPGLFRTGLEIAGTDGLIEWNSFQPPPLTLARHDPTAPQHRHIETRSPLAATDDPYYAQLAHVLDCLEHKRPFRVSPHDGVMNVKVALAALESMRSGQAIEIATFQEPSP